RPNRPAPRKPAASPPNNPRPPKPPNKPAPAVPVADAELKGCVIERWIGAAEGAVGVLGGAEYVRMPRLPAEKPPPALAWTSAVNNRNAAAIATNAVSKRRRNMASISRSNFRQHNQTSSNIIGMRSTPCKGWLPPRGARNDAAMGRKEPTLALWSRHAQNHRLRLERGL